MSNKNQSNERDSRSSNSVFEILQTLSNIQREIAEVKKHFVNIQRDFETVTEKVAQYIAPPGEGQTSSSIETMEEVRRRDDIQIGEKRRREEGEADKESKKKSKVVFTFSDDSSPIFHLPPVAIELIISRLDLHSVVALSQTCKFFYYYTSDDSHWKKFNDHHFKQFRIPLPYFDFNHDENEKSSNDPSEENINNNYIIDKDNANIISVTQHNVLQRKGELEKEYFGRRRRVATNWSKGRFFCGAIDTTPSKYNFLQINDMNPYQVTTSNLHELTEWDINTGEIISCFQVPNKCHNFGLRYNKMAVAGDDTVRVYDKESKLFLYEIEGLLSTANRLIIDGNYIVMGFWDGHIGVHNLHDGSPVSRINGHSKPIHALSVHGGTGFNSRTMIASGSSDKSVKVWNMFKQSKDEKDTLLANLRGHSMTINAIQFTTGGRQLLSASKDSQIKLWDLETNICIDILSQHTDSVNTMHAEEGWIVSGSSDETIRIWDLRTPSKLVHTLTGHEAPVNFLHFDEGKIVSCDDKRILLWRFDYLL